MLMAILILSIFVRFSDLENQMTHIDDIGVAWAMIVQVDETYNIDYVRDKINNISDRAHNTPHYKFLRELDRQRKLDLSLPYLKNAIKFFIVPQSFTYAPFQFLITSLLISSNQDYKSLLFWGRFPSFIFSIFALILAILAINKIMPKNIFLASVSGLLFLGFSWENIIYARHMSSYSMGIFAAIALFYLLIEILNNINMKISHGILIGLILAIIINMQYQILYFIPAFFIIWLFKIFKTERINFFSIKPIIGAIISFIIFILPSWFAFISPKAYLNGQAFIGSSYNFHIPSGENLYEMLKYSFNFFIENGFKITQFITTYVPKDSPYINILTIIFLLLVLFGILRMFFSKNNLHKYIGLFFIVSAATITGLIFMEKISFSPTRHSLIFLPYLVFSAAYGVSEFYDFFQKRIRFNFELTGALILAGLIIIPFFYDYDKVIGAREDYFNESAISDLAVKYQLHYIIASDMNLFFMDNFKNWRGYHSGVRKYNIFENPSENNSNNIMLISQLDLDDELCGKMLKEAGLKSDCSNLNILYESDFGDGSTLDILKEAHIIYNKLSIKIIKI